MMVPTGWSSRWKVALPVLALLAVLSVATAKAADNKSDRPAGPIAKGQRMFTCAHSFHAFVYGLVAEMAKQAGIPDHESAGFSGIGGSRVIQHWEKEDDKHQAKAVVGSGKVDVLTLSPIWLPDEGIDNFAKLGFEHNPNIRILVQEYWMPNDTYEPKYPLDTKKQVDHNATDLAELRKKTDQYCRDMEAYCTGINKRLGKDILLVVPVGEASIALREKIVAGKAPGLTKQWDLFRDMWGHPQPPLQVLDGYCYFAEIYRRSPVGLPVPTVLTKMTTLVPSPKVKLPPNPTPHVITGQEKVDLNRLLQEIAWETVTHHPMTGLTPDSPAK